MTKIIKRFEEWQELGFSLKEEEDRWPAFGNNSYMNKATIYEAFLELGLDQFIIRIDPSRDRCFTFRAILFDQEGNIQDVLEYNPYYNRSRGLKTLDCHPLIIIQDILRYTYQAREWDGVRGFRNKLILWLRKKGLDRELQQKLPPFMLTILNEEPEMKLVLKPYSTVEEATKWYRGFVTHFQVFYHPDIDFFFLIIIFSIN